MTGLRRERFVQIAGGAFVCGIGCVVAGLLGADALAVAPIMAVAAFAALATWAPRHAALAGLLGGLVAGISAGAIDEKGAWLGALEGAAIGGLIGALAGYVSAKLGRNARVLAGAGAGIASGVGLITLVLLALQQSDALDRQSEGILVLMWITLPLVNAISDYVSLGVSHWLGLRASRRATGVIGYLFLGILDLVVAVALLALTAALIKSGLSLADTIFASDLSPYAFLAAAVADPWGDGIWLSLMIISTLTWTYLHFAFAIVPAILASVILVLWEAPLLRRTQAMAAGGTLDFGVMTLIPLRRITFFVAWIVLALAPIWALFIASDMMERVLAALF